MTPHQEKLARAAISELRRGGHIMESRSEAGDWYNFRTSSGAIIPAQVIGRLVDAGVLTPSDDGLFGDSQTYRLHGDRPTRDELRERLWGRRHIVARANSKEAGTARRMGIRVVSNAEAKELDRLHSLISSAWGAS